MDATPFGITKQLYRLSTVGKRTVRLPKTESIYIYSDVAKLQAVGDTEASLLGIVPVTGNFGERCHWAFNPPIYMGVNKANIEERRVTLRTESGDMVPFPKDCPSVICCLRFRRRKSPI